MSAKRTRLSPVYLTAPERDLTRQSIDVLLNLLQPEAESHLSMTKPTKFARSFTRQRLVDLRSLFEDRDAAPVSTS
jgi:hypothetical protein